MTLRDALIRSALAGAATGARTFTGLAALSLLGDRGAREPERSLTTTVGRSVVGLAASGELAADKLPQAPSRLDVRGLGGRVVTSALCGVIVARHDLAPVPSSTQTAAQARRVRFGTAACVVTSLAAAAGTAVLGVRWRSGARAGTRDAWLRALAEDGVAVGVGVLAARTSR